jgi:hypothetical protein
MFSAVASLNPKDASRSATSSGNHRPCSNGSSSLVLLAAGPVLTRVAFLAGAILGVGALCAAAACLLVRLCLRITGPPLPDRRPAGALRTLLLVHFLRDAATANSLSRR